ncbi:MAG: HEAT repeat domain-containing protein [Pseudomonadota bacterium]
MKLSNLLTLILFLLLTNSLLYPNHVNQKSDAYIFPDVDNLIEDLKGTSDDAVFRAAVASLQTIAACENIDNIISNQQKEVIIDRLGGALIYRDPSFVFLVPILLGEKFLASEKTQAWLILAMQSNISQYIKAKCAFALGKFNNQGEKAQSTLINIGLKHDDPIVRISSAMSLGSELNSGDKASQALISLLGDLDYEKDNNELREAIIDSLSQKGNKEHPEVEAILSHYQGNITFEKTIPVLCLSLF